MQEMPDLRKTGKTAAYPKFRHITQADTEQLAKRMAHGTTFNVGEVKGMLHCLAKTLADLMAEGHSVKIEGIGVLTPALALRADKEPETDVPHAPRRNARSIVVGRVNFRPDKQLLRDINLQCELTRAPGAARRSSKRYTPQQRLQLAQRFLEENAVLTVADYRMLTGLLRTAATEELRQWAALPGSGIRATGRGSHRVYVRHVTAAPGEATQNG